MILFVIFCLFVVLASVVALVLPDKGVVEQHVVVKQYDYLKIRFSLLSKGFMRSSLDWHLAQYKAAFKHEGRMYFDGCGDLWMENPTQKTLDAVWEFNNTNPGVIGHLGSY